MSSQVTAEKLFQDLQAVVRDAEALLKATAGHMSGVAGDKVQEVRARAEESIKQARSRIDALEDETVHRAKQTVSEIDGYVRDNPWQALGVAAGVGLLLGLLVSRRQ